jgi:hypothetical protein
VIPNLKYGVESYDSGERKCFLHAHVDLPGECARVSARACVRVSVHVHACAPTARVLMACSWPLQVLVNIYQLDCHIMMFKVVRTMWPSWSSGVGHSDAEVSGFNSMIVKVVFSWNVTVT